MAAPCRNNPGDDQLGDAGTLRLLLSTDLLSGLLFAALGAGALYISWRYPAGTAARMGPGYFPHLVSSLLVLLGVHPDRARVVPTRRDDRHPRSAAAAVRARSAPSPSGC